MAPKKMEAFSKKAVSPKQIKILVIKKIKKVYILNCIGNRKLEYDGFEDIFIFQFG